MSNELISIDSAVWFDTGSSKISASSVNCGRIFCVKVCSRALVWFRTEETRLSTFLPAVKTSRSPLCKSSFPYSPVKRKIWIYFFSLSKCKNQSSKLNQIWFDGERKAEKEDLWRWLWAWFMELWGKFMMFVCAKKKANVKRSSSDKMRREKMFSHGEKLLFFLSLLEKFFFLF